MSDPEPTYAQVCALLEGLDEEFPKAPEGFRSGVAYATMRVQKLAEEQVDTLSQPPDMDSRMQVHEARRDLHEALTLLPAWDADRVRDLIQALERAVARHARPDGEFHA